MYTYLTRLMKRLTMQEMELDNCQYCDKQLRGRRDKKFCDTECRASYHNSNRAAHEKEIIKIQSILRNNRRIFKTLSPEGKTTVRKELIDNMGYQYQYFTSIFKSKKNIYYLVFDYGFGPIIQNNIQKVLIIKKQNYMNALGFEIWKGS